MHTDPETTGKLAPVKAVSYKAKDCLKTCFLVSTVAHDHSLQARSCNCYLTLSACWSLLVVETIMCSCRRRSLKLGRTRGLRLALTWSYTATTRWRACSRLTIMLPRTTHTGLHLSPHTQDYGIYHHTRRIIISITTHTGLYLSPHTQDYNIISITTQTGL